MGRIFVSGAFDDIRSRHLRFLQEAARLGPLTVLLWPDEAVAAHGGAAPAFGLAERRYFLQAVSYVEKVEVAEEALDPERLPESLAEEAAAWVVSGAFGAADLGDGGRTASAAEGPSAAKRVWCSSRGIAYRELGAPELSGFPDSPQIEASRVAGVKRVMATGTFDWLHTGHVRFFEEAAAYGELTVVVGHDANIRLLKGAGHPLYPEAERRFVVGSVRYVTRALISTGDGWLDAEPEMRRLRPDRYVVNEDGDKPEKRRYCEESGIEYIVLKRTPKEGLPRRTSSDLRGF